MDQNDNNHNINNTKKRKINTNDTNEILIKQYKLEIEKLKKQNKDVVHKFVETSKELKSVKAENKKMKSKMKLMEKETIKWKNKYETHRKNNAELTHNIQVAKLKLHQENEALKHKYKKLKAKKNREQHQAKIISNDCSKSEIMGLFQ